MDQLNIVSFIWNNFFIKRTKNLTKNEIANTLEVTYQPDHNGNGEEWVLIAEIDSMRKTKNLRRRIYLENNLLKVDKLFTELIARGMPESRARGIEILPVAKEEGLTIYKVGRLFYYEDKTHEDCTVIRISPYKAMVNTWIENSRRNKLLKIISDAIQSTRSQEITELEKERHNY